MNDDLQEAITKAVTDGITTAMKSVPADFAETLTGLASHMDERFDAVDARMDRFEGRMGGLELRIDGIDGRFDRLEARLENLEDSTREGFDRVNTTLDGIVGRLDDDEVERAALTAQTNRHEDWIVEAALSTGVKYVPGV